MKVISDSQLAGGEAGIVGERAGILVERRDVDDVWPDRA